MSNDFILGCIVGFIFTEILALVVYSLLSSSEKNSNNISYISFQTFWGLFLTFIICIVFDLIILNSISDKINKYANWSINAVLVALSVTTIILDYLNTRGKQKNVLERFAFNMPVHLGLFSLVAGLICCIAGWTITEGNLLTYGGIFIAIGSFFFMFFIAIAQAIDSQKKDKT